MKKKIHALASFGRPEVQHKYIIGWKRNVFYAKYYLTDSDRREIMTELNSTALILFEYYLRLACNEKHNPELTDPKAARDLGLNKHTVRKLRSGLIKKGWVLIVKTPRNPHTGHKACLYYLGKEAVENPPGVSNAPMNSLFQP